MGVVTASQGDSMPTLSPPTTPYYGGGQVTNPANVIPTSGPPSALAIHNAVGTIAVDNTNAIIYGLASVSGGVATWAILGGSASAVATLSGDTGTATPSGGNIKISGTANQVTTAASGATVTLCLPSAITAPGSLVTTTSLASTTTMTAGTGLTATTGNITATAGNLISTAGNLQLNGATNSVKINASAPTTSAVGLVTLSGSATTTLTSSAITANSIILFSLKTLGTLTASAITYTTTGGSATITPAGSTDTSVYGYMIIN